MPILPTMNRRHLLGGLAATGCGWLRPAGARCCASAGVAASPCPYRRRCWGRA